jgi:hypothetical protein
MKRGTLVQDMVVDVAEHWRIFLDDTFERELFHDALRFDGYELLENRQTEDEIVRRIRCVPRLELPARVRKVLGPGIAYMEEGRFDRKAQVWRSRFIPSVLADRLTSTVEVRAEPAGPGRCRRTIEYTVEARIFGVGGMVESALEKSVRSGWENSARFMNGWRR